MNKADSKFVAKVLSVGIGNYQKVLATYKILGKQTILDVGCGPGHWSIAASKLNPQASIVGIDINDSFVEFANKYKEKNNAGNCTFIVGSYEALPEIFSEHTFDVILCNGFLMYVDIKTAMQILSKLLKPKGVILMFFNHKGAFYIYWLLDGLVYREWSKVLYSLQVLTVNVPLKFFFQRVSGNTPVFFTSLRKTARQFHLDIYKLRNDRSLLENRFFLQYQSYIAFSRKKS